MFIWFYRLIFAPLALLSLPGYLIHIRRRGGYREKFGTRFGLGLSIPPKAPGKRRIWIQAVSLGEILAIEPLVAELIRRDGIEIFLTVTTSTGYAEAQRRYRDSVVAISYFPTDFWLFSRRVWNRAQADLALCAETELWPEHMQQAHLRGVPMILVNGRLSDRSFQRMRSLHWLVGGMLGKLAQVFACSDIDAERFKDMGLPASRVETTGNLKVDVVLEPILNAAERAERKRELGLGDGFVLLGSSTWPGEEAALLEAFRSVREQDESARLLIVPRHAERRVEIEALLRERAADLRWHFKSRGAGPGALDLLVADTHGELRELTQLADLAFVGKTLPPHREGQTPVECGALGVPMVVGPSMTNFRSIRAGLRQAGALVEVADALELVEQIVRLRNEPQRLKEMGAAGRSWHRANRGAVERTVAGVLRWLERA